MTSISELRDTQRPMSLAICPTCSNPSWSGWHPNEFHCAHCERQRRYDEDLVAMQKLCAALWPTLDNEPMPSLTKLIDYTIERLTDYERRLLMETEKPEPEPAAALGIGDDIVWLDAFDTLRTGEVTFVGHYLDGLLYAVKAGNGDRLMVHESQVTTVEAQR